MRILLFGKYGQLGWELERTLACLGPVTAIDYPELDFKKPETLPRIIQEIDPELIIISAAYTDVDKAESEPDVARLINATSVGVIAEEARKRKVPVIHYSTDYVYDGTKGAPYKEEDNPNPINVYGQSKLEGERAIAQVGGMYLIFRTSWVYSLRTGGFVNKVNEWARTQPVIRIVDDQIGNPTWARMLAEVTTLVISGTRSDIRGNLEKYTGIYHLAGDGYVSRFGWAREIFSHDPILKEHLADKLLPAKTSDYPTPARRPLFSALNCERFKSTFGLSLPSWKTALSLCMDLQDGKSAR
jgi:dTDP-4-dehydrorhamnose reductase